MCKYKFGIMNLRKRVIVFKMCLVNIENNFGFELFLNRVNQNLIESVKKIVNIELRVPLSLLFLFETLFINVR